MNKRIIFGVAVSVLVVYGIGFLAVNNWHVPPHLTSVLRPGTPSGTWPGLSLDAATAALPPKAGPELALMNYQNIRDLGTLPPDEVARIYDLSRLPHADEHLVMSQRTRVIVENLLEALPREEVARSKSRLEQAVALHYGPQVAAEFSGLLGEYVNYMDTIIALSNERNARGVTVMDAPDDDALRQRLQNEAFGKDKAASLFKVERDMRALMAKQALELKGSAAKLSAEQIERMNAEYETVLMREISL